MRKTVVLTLACIVCGIVAAAYPLRVLTLRNNDNIIVLHIVKPKNTFLLKYLHSVALSDVWERFVIDSDCRIVLIETKYQGQGAGLPTSLSGNEQLTREGKWFRITGMNRVVPLISWRVEKRWHNRFRFDNEGEKDISRIVGDALVLIRVEEMKLLSWLGYRIADSTQNLIKRR